MTIETTNGAISLKNVVGTTGGNGSDLVVNAGTSTTSLSTISTNINDLTVSGTGVITLTGDITTADYTSGGSEDVGAQSYSGAVVLSGADRTVTANTGAITFSSTINSEASAARALSIVGIDGAVTVSGAIGTGTNGILGALDINTAEAAGNTGTISLAAIGTDSAAGAASITVGNSRTATLTLAGVEYFSTGAQTYESDDFNLTGADITIQTTNSNVTFQDGVAGQIVLSDTADLTIDTGSGAGNISITPTIAGTAGGDNRSEDITLDAGTGNIELLNTGAAVIATDIGDCLLYTSPSPRD